jgi:hypothetical protein
MIGVCNSTKSIRIKPLKDSIFKMNTFQFKVTLCNDPPIWRRILLPGSFTFADFHTAIQDSMGWKDYHLYEFYVVNPLLDAQESIGPRNDYFPCDSKMIDSYDRKIIEIFNPSSTTASYVYDFGDYWEHLIEVEKILEDENNIQYPQLINGQGACPPEDCGGIYLFKKLLSRPSLSELEDGEIAALVPWRNKLESNEDKIDRVFFRDPPSMYKEISPEEQKLWLIKLLQGKISIKELKRELGGKIPPNDIEILLDCVLKKPLRFRNRAIGILSLHKGISKNTITEFLYINRMTLKKTLDLYRSCGIKNIISDKGKRPLKHKDPDYIKKFFSILHSPPSSYGFNRTTWRQDDIKKVMADSNMPISKTTIKNIIDNSGYKYKKAKTVLTSNDPQYKEKINKIKTILSNLGPREKFFSIDEYGPFAVKLQGGRSLVPHGKTKTVPQWQKSKGSIIITAALELSTNQITHFYSKNKNTTEMIKLLNILVDKYSDEECVYFSWDAASWHASKELYKRVDEINNKEYRENKKLPLVKLAPLPTCAQFLNVIESVFSGMARAIIHNSDYKSVEECKSAIDKYFSERNENFQKNPKRAGNKIWGKERVTATFSESHNCKDPMYR